MGPGNHHAGVIVLQEIWGVNAHIQDVCNRFARLGYTAIAPDLFHRSAGPRFAVPYAETTGRDHAGKLTPDGVRADLSAVHARLTEILSSHEDVIRIAACGFCMGGRLAWNANALLPLSCAVSFYGGGIHGQLDLAEKQNGPLLLFWGGKDGFITKEHRRATADALEAAGKRFTEVNVGHADHGFFCDQRPMYDREAASEAWGLVTAFFASNLDPT
jgi:carboxymethylenebutenolidase